MGLRSTLPFRLAWVALGCAGCRDWDLYDPRLGEGGQGPSSSSASSGGQGGAPPQGGSDEGGGGAPAGGAPSQGGGGSGSGGGPQTVEYGASVADCIDPAAPDPDACEQEVGVGKMTVDSDFFEATARNSYLRFDLDQAIAGATVDEVVLVLRVPVKAGAESTSSGDLWEVAPFDRDDLFGGPPATAGSTPLVADLGMVELNQTVEFTLPASLVSAGGSVYLGLLPLVSNGVDYFNINGTVPPRLRVTFH